jgi:hypothetical protein
VLRVTGLRECIEKQDIYQWFGPYGPLASVILVTPKGQPATNGNGSQLAIRSTVQPQDRPHYARYRKQQHVLPQNDLFNDNGDGSPSTSASSKIGYVGFMRRQDAEAAYRALNGLMVDGQGRLLLDWARPLDNFPEHPLYSTNFMTLLTFFN